MKLKPPLLHCQKIYIFQLFHGMPRIKYRYRKVAIAISVTGVSLTVIIYTYLFICSCASRELYISSAIGKVVNALGTRDTAALVRPNEPTTILEPALKNCQDGGSDILALLMVISSPGNRENRDAIRLRSSYIDRRFESNADLVRTRKKLKVLFFIGLSNETTQDTLKEEWRENDDMVLDDMAEAYLNLTLKTLRMLKWSQWNCGKAEFLVKIDDDVHLNGVKFLDFLAKVVTEVTDPLLVAGHTYDEPRIDNDPDSKWFTPDFLWPSGVYPNFIAGFFYILGREAAARIYRQSLQTPFFHMEDVFLIGIVANEGLRLNLTNIPAITTIWPTAYNYYMSSCDFQNYFLVHSLESQNVRCFNEFNAPQFSCSSLKPIFLYC